MERKHQGMHLFLQNVGGFYFITQNYLSFHILKGKPNLEFKKHTIERQPIKFLRSNITAKCSQSAAPEHQ